MRNLSTYEGAMREVSSTSVVLHPQVRALKVGMHSPDNFKIRLQKLNQASVWSFGKLRTGPTSACPLLRNDRRARQAIH